MDVMYQDAVEMEVSNGTNDFPSAEEMELALEAFEKNADAPYTIDGFDSSVFETYFTQDDMCATNSTLCTLCKECVEKSVKHTAEFVDSAITKDCEEALKKPNPDPRAVKFCKFAKDNPKAAIIAVMIKMHFHPIVKAIRICYFYGVCAAEPPSYNDEEHREKRRRREEEEEETLLLMGAQKVTEMMEFPEKEFKASKKDGDCTTCVKSAIHDIEQGYEKAAHAVCQYVHNVPNDEIKKYCQLVATKPKQAFAILLKALNLSMEKIKDAAMQACEQQGICSQRPTNDADAKVIKLAATR